MIVLINKQTIHQCHAIVMKAEWSIDVDSLTDRMDVLEHTRRRDYAVQISFNQICLIHRLLLKHRKDWNTDPDDPVLKILAQLEPNPENVKHSENHTINIRLASLAGDDDENENENDKKDDSNEKWRKIFNMGIQDPFVTNIRSRVKAVLLNPDDCEAAIAGINKYITQQKNAEYNDSKEFKNFL